MFYLKDVMKTSTQNSLLKTNIERKTGTAVCHRWLGVSSMFILTYILP